MEVVEDAILVDVEGVAVVMTHHTWELQEPESFLSQPFLHLGEGGGCGEDTMYYMQYLRLLYNKYKQDYARFVLWANKNKKLTIIIFYREYSRYTGTYPEDSYSSGFGGDPSLVNFDSFMSS